MRIELRHTVPTFNWQITSFGDSIRLGSDVMYGETLQEEILYKDT